MKNECKPTFEEFAKEVRSALPNVDITFVNNAKELEKVLDGCSGAHLRASLYLFPNGAHQLAVSTSKNAVILLASYEDETPATKRSKDSITPSLNELTKRGQIGLDIIGPEKIGTLPPAGPPCPRPPLCVLTMTLIATRATGSTTDLLR